ncbi:MAG: ClpXP protease specificity-enhancing factor SspB [Parvularculaceae bacterium]
MTEDIEIDYNDFIQEAQKKAYKEAQKLVYRFLIRDVLTLVAELGDAPGEHHFFIEFATKAPGVILPDHLLEQYPERMTIVLQHQFEELTVDDDKFAVTLWFKSKEARLEVPYSAVTQFADPSAKFGLNIDAGDGETAAPPPPPEASVPAEPSKAPEEPAPAPAAKKKGDGADVVSLDSFRKK